MDLGREPVDGAIRKEHQDEAHRSVYEIQTDNLHSISLPPDRHKLKRFETTTTARASAQPVIYTDSAHADFSRNFGRV